MEILLKILEVIAVLLIVPIFHGFRRERAKKNFYKQFGEFLLRKHQELVDTHGYNHPETIAIRQRLEKMGMNLTLVK